MIHKPSGFLSGADCPVNLVGTDTVLAVDYLHMASNHLSRLRGESSKMVPVFDVNWRRSCLLPHCQRLYFAWNRTFFEPQRGQVTPSGQRWESGIRGSLSGLENQFESVNSHLHRVSDVRLVFASAEW